MIDIEKERLAFEEWSKQQESRNYLNRLARNRGFFDFSDGEYIDCFAQDLFTTWLARANLYSRNKDDCHVKERRWISVNDRLPHEECEVLCVVKGLVKVLFFRNNHWHAIGSWVIYEKKDVTHWMPVPELPQNEKD